MSLGRNSPSASAAATLDRPPARPLGGERVTRADTLEGVVRQLVAAGSNEPALERATV